MTIFQFKQCFHNLTKKEKSYLSMKQSQKQESDSYGIDKFQSISLSGRTYLLKIPHGRMRILYISIQNYLSIEDNTILKERGMLGHYKYQCIPLIVNIVPMQTPYFYCCALQKPTIVIVVPLNYYFYVGSDYIVTPQTPIYRKEVFSVVSSKNCSFV